MKKQTKQLKRVQTPQDTTHHVNIPWTVYQSKIREYIQKIWATRWKNLKGHRLTKLFLNTPDPNKANGILRIFRGYLTVFVRAITGHNFLAGIW